MMLFNIKKIIIIILLLFGVFAVVIFHLRISTLTVVKELGKCPQISKNITGHVDIDVHTLNSTFYQNGNVKLGGRYKPLDCEARHRVAVIVPYRDRENHLKIFLRYMHPFLQRQYLNYGIYVVESIPGVKFNRGVLLNTGFVEANKLYDYDCIIIHDVDLLPENEGIPYTCDQSPVHLSVTKDVWNYTIPNKNGFGGVNAIAREHFKKVNGFSNIYFEWGREDDDLYSRLQYSHMNVTQLSGKLGRYKKLKHPHAKVSPNKDRIFQTRKERYMSDGLNSLKSNVIKLEYKRLYTWILVSINETEIMNSEPIHKKAFKKPKTH